MQKIDLVYFNIMGPHNGLELKFSLRSIEKYFYSENYQVHVIGESPSWLNHNTVNFIPVKTLTGRDYTVYYDIINKFHIVCNTPEIGKDFYRMMDDIYFINPIQKPDLDLLLAMEDFSGAELEKRIATISASLKWKALLIKTIETLKSRNLPLISYTHHLPQKFNKTNLLKLFSIYNIPAELYLIGTLYNNHFLKRKPDLFLLPKNEIKLGIYENNITSKELHRFRANKKFLNHGADSFTPEMIKFLEDLFPLKSKFEN